jgi:hypothetical protein
MMRCFDIRAAHMQNMLLYQGHLLLLGNFYCYSRSCGAAPQVPLLINSKGVVHA